MTYPNDFTLPSELMEQVQEQGLNVLPELIRVIINTAMLAQRTGHLNAGPYQHTSERRGYANGFKPKTVQSPWKQSSMFCLGRPAGMPSKTNA